MDNNNKYKKKEKKKKREKKLVISETRATLGDLIGALLSPPGGK